MDSLFVPSRYRGPAKSGNGGYVAGALAGYLGHTEGRAVQVRLQQPPPLDVTMQVNEAGEGLQLSFGGAVVATAVWSSAEVRTVEGVSFEDARAASASYPGHTSHPFPGCFSCGPEREDGLRIFPGAVQPGLEGNHRVAAPWTPDATLAVAAGDESSDYDDPTGRASLAATWSALDCVSGWASDIAERPMVLGQMTAVVDELPVIGEPHVVTGEALGTEGRKNYTASTVHDADGRIVGRAEHVWLVIDPDHFNG